MVGGMLDAARGCMKEEMRMDLISNNLANSNVVGFKKDVISFQDLLSRGSGAEGSVRGGKMENLDPALIQIKTDVSQGDVRFTGGTFDFAIYGEGYFKVDTPDGVLYTRKGNFTLDNKGYLITQEGYRVLGNAGPIVISGTDIQVDGEGIIMADGLEAGRIGVARFEGRDALVKAGLGCYRNVSDEPELSPSPDTRVAQGYVELSNVNVAEEMVAMIHSMRAFESYQKAIQVLDDVNNKAINEVSRLK